MAILNGIIKKLDSLSHVHQNWKEMKGWMVLLLV